MRKKNYRLIVSMVLLAFTYVICFFGMVSNSFPEIFRYLVPFTILLSVVVLCIFHQSWNRGVIFTLTIVIVAGFGIEAAGRHTGLIFGSSSFGNSLGWKLFDTPLIIGVNWLLLVYITHVAVRQIGIERPWIELTAAAIITALDYLMEPVAIRYDLWHWENNIIPVQNFFAWFYISFFMQLFFNQMKPVKENQVAIPLLVLQIVFYAALNIF